jgi:calcium-dependent protein kinase
MPESCGGKFQFNILHERLKKDVFRKYEVLEVLGQGSMGAVSKVCIRPDKIGGSAFQFEQHWGPFGIIRRKKRSGMVVEASQTHEYALKTILLDRVSDVSLNELRNEISILKTLDHPNIIRLHEVYVYKKQIYMVLDLCDGGDLFSRVPYSEHDAARYTAQIASAVLYLHQHHCVHRDLKFENIMFESENTIKVIDFGLSKKFIGASTPTMNDRVGTLYSMAPQVLQGVYSEQADCWSMGVISYMLLGSRKPFYHKNRRQMIDRIMRATYNFEGLVWDKVSDGGKDFVSKLLVVDPSKRMTAAMALQHEWLVNREQWPDEKPQVDLLRKLDDSLCKYKHTSAIKMIALNVIAHRSTSDQVAEMRKAFEAFDRNKNGIITYEEFKDALESSSLPNESLQEIFDSVVRCR